MYRTWNSRPISAATRSRVHRWSSAHPHTAGPASSAARSRASCAPAQPAHRPARAPGGQGGFPASAPAPPPRVRRITRDPKPPRHLRRLNPLREPLRGLQPHLLPPDPPSGGQATTIRIPHIPAIAPPAAPVTTAPCKIVTRCDNPDNSISVAEPASSLKSVGSAIDITLRNRGAAPALIVGATFSFTRSAELNNCIGAGPEVVTAQ